MPNPYEREIFSHYFGVKVMWGKTLTDINSFDINDLHEYSSRPTGKVLELMGERKNDEIVFYGASGKWMSDLAEMILRAIRETGITGRKVHLVSRFSRKDDFEARFAKYSDLYVLHEIDLVNAKESDLREIPDDAPWVIYGVGYKFRTNETEEEYIRLCRLYGSGIPQMVFEHHKYGADIVVIGSANGIELTRVDDQAKDDAPLVPMESNLYGQSIRDKESILIEILEKNVNPPSPLFQRGNNVLSSQRGNKVFASKAVILRGGYMTDFTYGGLEPIVLTVLNEKEIDLAKLAYFNIIGHRDANVYVILSVGSASNPVMALNLSGHTVDVRQVADSAGRTFGKPVRYKGKPAELHLLMDSSKIESLYGKPMDTLDDLINGQIYWIKNGGYSKALNHHVGESM